MVQSQSWGGGGAMGCREGYAGGFRRAGGGIAAARGGGGRCGRRGRSSVAPDSGADVRHAVVVADVLVLVVGVGLACLRCIEENAVLGLGVGAYESFLRREGYHLVAVEAEHAVAPEGAERHVRRRSIPRRRPLSRYAVASGDLRCRGVIRHGIP